MHFSKGYDIIYLSNLDKFAAGKIKGRKYRNRRIGELFKEIDLSEKKGTGIPKILRELRQNGSPEPKFDMETEYYYDTKNERILMLFDGRVDVEDDPELFEDISEGFVEDYIPLPGQYDINEYRIMEEFIYELPAGKNQDVLAGAIQGRGAFRRFKDKLYDLNLEKQWYQYRDEAYEKIARQWCERHKINLVE